MRDSETSKNGLYLLIKTQRSSPLTRRCSGPVRGDGVCLASSEDHVLRRSQGLYAPMQNTAKTETPGAKKSEIL